MITHGVQTLWRRPRHGQRKLNGAATPIVPGQDLAVHAGARGALLAGQPKVRKLAHQLHPTSRLVCGNTSVGVYGTTDSATISIDISRHIFDTSVTSQ